MTRRISVGRKSIAFFLSMVLVAMSFVVAVPVSANAVTQSEIDQLKKEREAIAAERDAQQAVIDELADKQADALATKKALEEKNSITQQQIEINRQTIEMYDAIIAEKSAEVDKAKQLEEEQLNRYRSRVRAMEENGNYDFLALLFNLNGFGELLTAIDDIGEIMRSDKELEDQYIAAREKVEEVVAEYESYRSDVQEKQEALKLEQAVLESDIQANEEKIDALQLEINDNQDILDEIESQWDEINEQVNAKIKQLEAERAAEAAKAAAAAASAAAKREQQNGGGSSTGGGTGGVSTSGGSSASNTVVGTGAFGWPCPSCYYITSRVGNRWHPISGQWKYHSGLDIGAQSGAAIVASDSGTVSLAEWYGGYGNCIMINHGNGYYTLYGHMSGYAVSYGQTVSKGQTIGYVGSTGNSTGPHLHFEIRSGSVCLDPENFFSGGFTYAPDAGD